MPKSAKKSSSQESIHGDYRPVIVGDITNGFDLFKLGDPKTGWVPEQTMLRDFAHFLESVAYPRSFMVYHYAIQVKRWRGKYAFLLGDPNTGWIPTQQNCEAFGEAVKTKLKSGAIIFHYGVDLEMVEPQNNGGNEE